jgi:hypothetical protein
VVVVVMVVVVVVVVFGATPRLSGCTKSGYQLSTIN